MDLDPNIAPYGTAMATITAKNSNTSGNMENLVQPDTNDLDPNICPDIGLDIVGNRLSGSAAAIASNSEDGMILPLDQIMTSKTDSDQMDMTTAIETAKDLESFDPNVASDKGSDTVQIQLSASATAIASVMATQDSDDNESRFSGSSSEEYEFMDDDDGIKEKKKKKNRVIFIISEKKIAFDNCEDKNQKKE